MTMTHHTQSRIYPANKLLVAVAAMEEEGITATQALQGTGIEPQELKSPTTKISIAQLLASYRNALKYSPDPAFAIRLGRSIQITTYGIYGYALFSAPNHRAVIETAVKYSKLMLPAADLSFREESGANVGAWVIEPRAIIASEPNLYRFIVDTYLGSLAALSEDIFARPKIRKEIRLSYPYSPGLPAYEEFFQCSVLFEQSCNELRIDTTWMDEPMRRHNELTFQTVQKICAEMLEQMGPTSGIARELRLALLESTGRFPSFEAICQRFGTSPRTMRRKLQIEGTSYGALVNETRIRLAKKYLRETVMTIDEIAIRISYSGASNFRRAFQRATDVTPSAFRCAARDRQTALPRTRHKPQPATEQSERNR